MNGRTITRWLAVGALLLATGCASAAGVVGSSSARIWVVRDLTDVFRCADGAGPEGPPRPVCVRAPYVDVPGN